MKKVLVLVFLVLFIFSGVLFADNIGENFEAGGVSISGSGYYYNNLEEYWSFSFRPYVNFYLVDNLAFGFGLDLYRNFFEDNEIGFNGGISYTFGFDPEATTGVAVTAGLGLGYNNEVNVPWKQLHIYTALW